MKATKEQIKAEANRFSYFNQDQTIDHVYCGISTRLLIAKDVMCSLISNADRHSQEGDCQSWNYEHLARIALEAADILIKAENNERD